MYKYLISIISFSLFSLLVFSKGETDLLKKLNSEKTSEQALLNINISELYRNSDLDKSIKYIENAILISESLNNDKIKAKALKSAGVSYFYKSDYQKSLLYYSKASLLFLKFKDFDNLSKVYNNIGIIYERWGDYKNSMFYYLKCLRIENELNDTIGVAGSYNNIANTYFYIKDFDNGIIYLKKAYKIFKDNNKEQEANISNNIGVFFEKKGNLDSALFYYNKSLNIRKEINDEIGLSVSNNNIGYVNFLKNNYKKSIGYFKKSLLYSKKIKNNKQIISTLENFANTYIKLNKLDSTIFYLDESMQYSDSTNIFQLKLNYYKLISKVFKLKKDFKNSLYYFELYSNLKDSLLNNKKIESTELIYQKYDSEQKQLELKLKDFQIKKANKERKFNDKLNFMLILSIILLLGFITIIVYLLIINNKKSKKLNIETKTRKEIQKSLSFTKSKLINSLKNKDEEIINKNIYLNLVLKSLPIGIITSDKYGNIIFANKYASMSLGLNNPEEANGINLITDKRFQKVGVSNQLKKVIELKKACQFNIINTFSKASNNIIYKVTINPIENNKDEIYFGLIEDITLQKKYEDNLITSKELEVNSNKLKSIFLANISHEIRTPLNAIIGFSELLESEDISKEKSKTYLEIIQKNSKSLLNLINDIIDISKIEAGELKIYKKVTNINNLLKQICLVNKEIKIIQNPNLKIKLNITEKDDLLLITDENRLKQIIDNLVNNAIKFTPKGEINLGYTKYGDRIEFYIEDTGVGVPEKDLPTIFNRFFQASNQVEKINSGSGLGLAITKNLVELLGGTITCVSKINEGTKFTFSLPLDYPLNYEENVNAINTLDLKGLKVLIAEDNESNYIYLKDLLEKNNATVQRANNGFEAISKLKNDKNFDIIFMDIRMPIIDGITAFNEIKKLNINIPIIAQTAYASNDEREKYINIGFTDYISKPIYSKKLFDVIKKHCNLA